MNDWILVAETLNWARQREDWAGCTCGGSVGPAKCGFCRLADAERPLARLIKWTVASVWPAECHRVSPVDRMVLTWFDYRLDDLAKMRGVQPSPMGLLALLIDLGISFDIEPGPESPQPNGLAQQPEDRDAGKPKYAFWPP